MDSILFNMRRAHLLFEHRLSMKLLKPCALTPARFYALDAIARAGAWSQSRLALVLGVSRTTASRMARKLENVGFISRSVFRRGAKRALGLTRLGKRVLTRATRRYARPKLVRRRVDDALSSSEGDARFETRERMDDICRTIKTHFGEVTHLFYRWHPDD